MASAAAEEVGRVMQCQKLKADPFSILGLDIATCEFGDVARRYRKIVVLIHPDKCKLPQAGDAFKIVEKAYRTIPDEGILQRLKIAHVRKQEREARLQEESAKRAASGNSGISGVEDAGLTKEDRIAKMKAAAREDEYLEAARKAQDAALKKARHEKKTADDAIIAAALEKQINDERGMHLF